MRSTWSADPASREEFCVQQGWLWVSQLVGNVARKAEIRILVDRTWDNQGMSNLVPKICGKELENDGAAWIAPKCIFPMLSLKRNVAHMSYEK
jgi:hypothetical protein